MFFKGTTSKKCIPKVNVTFQSHLFTESVVLKLFQAQVPSQTLLYLSLDKPVF